MNDCIAAVDPRLMEKTLTVPDQLPGFVALTVDAYRDDVERDVQVAMVATLRNAGGNTLRFGQLRQRMLGEFFGRLPEPAYARLVKRLVANGDIRRQKRPAAKLDLTEILSLPAA